MSKFYYYFGSMSSGKTALLLMKAHSFEERGTSFLCIKPSIDDRDGEDIIKSRIGLSRECISFDATHNLYKFIDNYIVNVQLQGYDKPRWILVDECQFLTKEQVDQLAEVVDNLDVNVMCYGLRTDFKTNFFEGSKRLMEIADDIEELKSSCGCGRKAIVNARIDAFGNIVSDGEQIEIGGNDKYISLCRKCYHTLLDKQKKEKM
jgi:thymidine kinase